MSFADATIARLPRPIRPFAERHHELIKFAIVGATTFIIDSAIFYTLKLTILEPKPVTAKVIAGVVAVIASYILNREWSFRDRGGRERHHEALLFFAISGLNTRLNSLDTPVLWAATALVLLVAVGGKFLGTWATARLSGVASREAQALGAWLVHYSTDYVFDGSGQTPWVETDATSPLNAYGRSKLAGEQGIAKQGAQHVIFRTSWVYGTEGGNFAKTMLRLAQERDKLTVINDQHGAPTGADLIADVTAHAMRRVLNTQNISLGGVYHLVASGETTWHGYASYVIEQAKRIRPDLTWKVADVAPVPTSAFPTPAARPLNSRLCTAKLQQAFGLVLPPWQQGVDRMLAEIL